MPDSSRDLASLFAEAMELDAAARKEFLRELSDTNAREQLAALLEVHEAASGFLSRPPVTFVPTMNWEGLGPNDSVLKTLEGSCDVPKVVLTDSVVDGIDPIVRPNSPEMPRHEAESRYQLQGEIARGGMGAILKGRDVDLGRTLAVKVLLDSHKNNPEVVQRFIEEAQIGGQLQHPGVAPIYELGQFADGRPFFSMKLVKGQTLAALLAERSAPQQDRGRFLGIFEQVCQTMAYVHSRGVIHRDLKPANIMVGAFGEVQLMDWGLAKVLSAGGVADEKKARSAHTEHSVIQTLRSAGSSNLASGTDGTGSDTRMGSVMGTPAYMPPEQALGEVDRLDERCDVFGLGAILCEILTGKPPYVSDDSTETFRMAARGKLDECQQRLDICGADSELVSIARKCLELEPVDRPRNADEVARRISAYLESVETRLRETEVQRAAESARAMEESKRRKVTLALAASILVTLSILGGGWAWIHNDSTHRRLAAMAKVESALGQARLHQRLSESDDLGVRASELKLAETSARRAFESAVGGGVAKDVKDETKALLTRLKADSQAAQTRFLRHQRNARLVKELERIRLGFAGGGKQFDVSDEAANFDFDSTNQQYHQAFAEAGLNIDVLSADAAAKIIRESEMSEDLISALDHWARSIPKPSENSLAEAWVTLGNWDRAIRAARQRLQRERKDSVAWMYLASVQALAGKRAEWRRTCDQMIEQFRGRPVPQHQERAAKVCLLFPDGYDLNAVPTEYWFAAQRGEIDIPLGNLRWLHGVRALWEYRLGRPQKGLDYIDQSKDVPLDKVYPDKQYAGRSWYVESKIFNAGVRALCHDALNRPEEAKRHLEDFRVQLERRLSEKRAKSHDVWICLLLLREATEKIAPDSKSDPFANWQESSSLAGLPQAVRRVRLRPHLLGLANAADTNKWRRSLRKALEAEDAQAIEKLADETVAAKQPPAMVAWLGSALAEAESFESAVEVLQAAQQNHPNDFWLNYELAKSLAALNRADEALGYARAALAVRPRSAAATWTLCSALDDAGKAEEALRAFQQMLARTDMEAADLALLADGLNARGRYLQAEAAARRAIALSQNMRGHLVLGISLRNQERYDDAIQSIRTALRNRPQSYNANFALGYTFAEAGRDDDAIEAYQATIAVSPLNSAAHNNLGLLLKRQERYAEALREFREALRLNPSSRHAISNLSSTLFLVRQQGGDNPQLDAEIGRLREKFDFVREERIKYYHKKVKLNPRDSESRQRLATYLLADGQNEEALKHAKELSERERSQASLLLYAKALEGNGLRADAISQLREAAALPANEADDHLRLATALHNAAVGKELTTAFRMTTAFRPFDANVDLIDVNDELLDRAIEHYKIWFDTESSDSQSTRAAYVSALRLRGKEAEAEAVAKELRAEVLPEAIADFAAGTFKVQHVLTLQTLGLHDDALDLLDAFAQQHPQDTRAAAWRGRILLQLGRSADAVDYYQRLVAQDPKARIGYMGLARTYIESKEPEKAIVVCNDALAALADDEELATMFGIRGMAELQAGKYQDALRSYREALELGAQAPGFRAGIAGALYELGDKQAAIAECRQVIEEDGRSSSLSLAHQGLAYLLLLEPDEEGNFPDADEALAHAERGTRRMGPLNHHLAAGHSILGLAHYRLSRFDEALIQLKQAHAIDADEAEVWILLAMTHWRLGDKPKAQTWFAKAKAAHDAGGFNRAERTLFTQAQELLDRD